jgi:FecR-like protein
MEDKMENASEKRFKLNSRGALMAVISAALANPALANTGRVDFTMGNVNVAHGDGRVQPLTKGTELRSGDKVSSGVDGRAQIRFSDGAYVSLQPNTEFDIKEYRYNGKADGTESALFGLFKGAMRTVTGIVGRINRNKYQITTPTATIGIRGTGGLISVGNDGSTLVTGTSGVWSLSNNGGTLNIPAGTAGFAGANRNAPPQPADQGPVIPPNQPVTGPLTTLVQGDIVNSQGNPVLSTVLLSGPGYELAGVAPVGAVAPLLPAGLLPANAVFDGAGALTSFSSGTSTFALASGTQNEFGTDGILAWGRWTGVVTKNGAPTTITANDGLHYVIGMPATSMPTSGTFTYNLIGATAPTLANASVAPGTLNSASLVGNFTTGAVNVNMSVSAGGTTWGGSANGTILSTTFTATGSAIVTAGGSPLGCSSSCALAVDGLFSGAGATHAGIVYSLSTLNVVNGTPSSLSGTAALAR